MGVSFLVVSEICSLKFYVRGKIIYLKRNTSGCRYKLSELTGTIEKLASVLIAAPTAKLATVFQKYSSKKFFKITRYLSFLYLSIECFDFYYIGSLRVRLFNSWWYIGNFGSVLQYYFFLTFNSLPGLFIKRRGEISQLKNCNPNL